MLETISSHLFLQTLALTLVHFLWQGVLVACLLKIVLSVLGYQKSQWRYGFAAIAMLANLGLPIITFFTIYKPTYPALVSNFTLIPIADFQQSLQVNNSLWGYNEWIEFLPFLSCAWLISVFFLAGKLLLDVYFVRHLPQQRVVEPSTELNKTFLSLVERVGLIITPRLLISMKVDVPMAIGWLKPVVLIPAKMVTGLTEEQLEMLILHELAHIKRFDYLVNFFQTLIDILLFFHPCVHWVSKQMRQEREYCSDDIAVSHCGDAIAYAHTLTDTATLCRQHQTKTIPSMAMAASGGDLKQRVIRLVHHCSGRQNNDGRWFAGVLVIGIVLTITMLPYAKFPILDLSSGHIQLVRSDDSFSRVNVSEIENNLTEPVMPSTLAQQLLFQNSKIENASIFSPTTVVSLKNKIERATANYSSSTDDNVSQVAQAQESSASEMPEQLLPIKSNETVNSITTAKRAMDNKQQSIATVMDLNAKNSNAIILESNEFINALPPSKHEEQLNGYKIVSSDNPYKKQVSEIAINENQTKPTLLEQLESKPKPHPLLGEIQHNQSVEKRLGLSSNVSSQTVQPKRSKVYEAQLISSAEPRYPAMAKRKGIELDVKVNFIIGVDGKIKDIQFEDQSKISYFRHAILVAMEKWHFQPAQTNGKPIESAMSKIFSFSLVS